MVIKECNPTYSPDFLIDGWVISQIEPSAHLPYKELLGGAVGE